MTPHTENPYTPPTDPSESHRKVVDDCWGLTPKAITRWAVAAMMMLLIAFLLLGIAVNVLLFLFERR